MIGLHAVTLPVNSSHGSIRLVGFQFRQGMGFPPSFRRPLQVLSQELPGQGEEAADEGYEARRHEKNPKTMRRIPLLRANHSSPVAPSTIKALIAV
jgi:hypothetical protein